MPTGITFWELDGFPKETWTPTKFTAQRRILIDWVNRYSLQALLLAHPGSFYPYLGDWNVRCISGSIEPWGMIDNQLGTPADMAYYQYAILSLNYETPGYGEPQPYPSALDAAKHANQQYTISETYEALPNVFVGVKPGTLRAGLPDPNSVPPGGVYTLKDEDMPGFHLYVHGQYSVTRHYQQTVPQIAFDEVGSINKKTIKPILINGPTFLPTTLRYEGASFNYSRNDSGLVTMDITYRFEYKGYGWDKVPRPDLTTPTSPVFDDIKFVSTGVILQHRQVDFLLFLPQGP